MDRSTLKENITGEKLINDSLKKRIEFLKTDSLEIERIAREYYGMTKPQEKLYIFKKRKNDEE